MALPARGQSPAPANREINNRVSGTYEVNGAAFAAAPDSVSFVVGIAARDTIAPVLRVTKSVSAATAAIGGTLTYTIDYETGTDGGTAHALEVADALPATLVYEPGSLVVNGMPLTDVQDADAGSFDGSSNQLLIRLGTTAPGTRGRITLRARVAASAQPEATIANEVLLYQAADPANAVSARASFSILAPIRAQDAWLRLTKQVDKQQAFAGDTVVYTIGYRADGAGALTEIRIADQIPAGARYVPGSFRHNDEPVSDAAVSDSAFITLASLRGASGTMRFRAVLADTLEPGAIVTNHVRGVYMNYQTAYTTPVSSASTTILKTPATLNISKTVDIANAQAGDVLTYTVQYEVEGPGRLDDVVITDTLSAALEFIAGSLTHDGQTLTDEQDADAGSYAAAANAATVRINSLASGTRGTITLRARVRADVARGAVIANSILGRYENGGTTETVTSGTAQTTVRTPEISIRKSITGAPNAWVGDAVRYRIVVRNTSASITLRDIVVSDTIPAGLEHVAAAPASATSGPALHWSLSDLAPGDSTIILVDTRVTQETEERIVVNNRAHAQARGAAASSNVDLTIMPGDEMRLAIVLSSDVLEVVQGDVAPLTAEVSNTGSATLEEVLVEIILPEGTSYVPGSILGADSVAVTNGRVIVRLPAALPVGAKMQFRYSIAIIAPTANVLQNTTIASAQNRTVFSNRSELALRMRRNRAVETHTVIGNVWLDQDGNGKLDDGEAPAAGVDVWSNDGAVARTDAQGRFSFTNVRAGTYVFRADPATMPNGFRAPSDDDGLERVRVTGWTTPRVMLPLAPVMSLKASSAGESDLERLLEVEDSLATGRSTTVRTAPARTDEQRAASRGRSIVAGPGLELFGVKDGTVTGEKRVFIGVRAEPLVPVALFRGDSLIEEGSMRVDGVYDFLGVELKPGPNVLRVRVTNSWKKERWDSLLVHMSGAPAKLIPVASRLTAPADGKAEINARVRVLDRWNIPVVNRPLLNVSVDGMTIVTKDAHASAVGSQVRVDADGWAMIRVKAGLKVMNGTLRLSADAVKEDLPVALVAPVLPFMLIGTGEIGIGAAAESFASITARGSLDERTSLTVSVDTRRVEDNEGAFARAANPLAEGSYPILGDATERRSQSASHAKVSARIERGLDYLAFGDVQMGLSEDITLMRYARSVTGAAGEVTTGAVKWSGFGALTAQSLQQLQMRGRGTSGPYEIGSAIVAGSDRVHIEVRDRDNPQHVKNRQTLAPFVDYEIDYTSGVILLKRPLASIDGAGNPLFLVVTAETRGGGDRAAVWGARVHTDFDKLLHVNARGLAIGASYVHDGQSLDAVQLAGIDVKVTPVAGMNLRAEVAHSQAADSSGTAAIFEGSLELFKDALTLNGRYSHTGDGFGNPANVALQTTTEDFRFGAALKIARGSLKLDHSTQNFETQDIERSRTSLSIMQPLAYKTQIEARFVRDGATGGANTDRQAGAGELKLTWSPSSRLKMWGESRGELWTDGGTSTGDYVGGGMSWQALQDVWLEARHLQMKNAAGSGYSMTNIGIRSTVLSGSQAWGSYQITGGIDGATSAAVVGLNNRFQLTNSLKLNTLFERREGISRAPQDDPVNALPFPQQESDYWSAGLGVEYLPAGKPYRLTAKSEHKTGQQESVTSAMISGDVAFNNSLALLSRQEYMRHESGSASQVAMPTLDHKSSTWGLALRPGTSNALNALVELRWVSDRNPRGGRIAARSGLDERLIGAAEMIWSPLSALEVGARYAMRATRSLVPIAGLADTEVRSSASFSSLRADLDLTRWAGLRAEARSMDEQLTSERAWDVAPSLLLRPVQGIEISAGHRWGELRDVDFATNGGAGWFMSMGFRVTEASMPGAAAFWRDRFGR